MYNNQQKSKNTRAIGQKVEKLFKKNSRILKREVYRLV